MYINETACWGSLKDENNWNPRPKIESIFILMLWIYKAATFHHTYID